MSIERTYLDDLRAQFRGVKTLAERALAQVADADLGVGIDGESNSLAVIVTHMAGNLRSRFSDFLTTDGEKPDRNRDAEFEARGVPDRAALVARWESGWRCLFDTLDALTPDDLLRDVFIRGERMSALHALNRALVHQAQHAGQIVFLAKHLRSSEWKTLSIPRGRSSEAGARRQTTDERPSGPRVENQKSGEP